VELAYASETSIDLDFHNPTYMNVTFEVRSSNDLNYIEIVEVPGTFTITRTFFANEYVEVRSVGTLDDFDWIRFGVKKPEVRLPSTKQDCQRKDVVEYYAPLFKNQGDCVSFVMRNEKATKNK